MALILPQRWTRQPHYKAQVDPRWLAKGLNQALLAMGNSMVDCTPKGIIGSGGVRSNGNSRLGRTVLRTSGVYAFRGLMQNATTFSLIAVVKSTNVGAENVISTSHSTAANRAIQFTIRVSQIELISANQFVLAASTNSGLTNGRTHVIGLTYNHALSQVIFYCDGKKLNTATGNETFSLGGSGSLFVKSDGGNPLSGGLGLHLDFNKVLSPEDMIALTANPFQVFAPIRPWYYVAAAGGAFSIDAQSGSFALAGINASLLKSKAIDAQVGAFSLTGVNANLSKGRVLDCNTGTFALAGQNADLLKSKLILSVAGAFSLAGQNADLEYVPAPSDFSIDALPGAFVLTGISATILKSKAIDANTGAFTLTGVNATLARGRVLDANAGAFALSGVDASLLKSKSIDAVAGAFTMTGRIALLEYSGAPEVDNNPMKPVSILVYSQLGAK